MIIEAVLNLIFGVVKFAFSWISLPQVQEGVKTAIYSYFDMIFNNLSFLGFFVRINTLKSIALIAITLITFKRLYQITMWIIRKLPIGIN